MIDPLAVLFCLLKVYLSLAYEEGSSAEAKRLEAEMLQQKQVAEREELETHKAREEAGLAALQVCGLSMAPPLGLIQAGKADVRVRGLWDTSV